MHDAHYQGPDAAPPPDAVSLAAIHSSNEPIGAAPDYEDAGPDGAVSAAARSTTSRALASSRMFDTYSSMI